MGKIVLCRVDSRLVHGQVVTKWVNQVGANKIVIIKDDLVNDPFLLSIYEMSAPPGMKVLCFDESSAKDKIDELSNDSKVLLLFADVASLKRVYDLGLELKNVQIGGLGGGPDRKPIYKNITLDDEDFNYLKSMHDAGVVIEFQIIPEDKPYEFEEVIKKF